MTFRVKKVCAQDTYSIFLRWSPETQPMPCTASTRISSVFCLLNVFQIATGFLYSFFFALELLSSVFFYTLALILWDFLELQSYTKRLLAKLLIIGRGVFSFSRLHKKPKLLIVHRSSSSKFYHGNFLPIKKNHSKYFP